MKKFIINNVEVEFKAIENEIFTSSLQIAEVFGKKHTEVMADIDDMSVDFEIRDDSHKVDELYIQSVKWGKYTDEKGREEDMCLLSKDGFMFLFMRFDVTYAIEQEWGLRYVKAFNETKDELTRVIAQQN
jgi:phage regulatory protein, rha family|nr:MAG TPA: regulatory protein [Siphoviridae sp. ctUxW2]